MKKALAWLMLSASAAGIVASAFGLVGEGEPQLVLQLSWFALFYSAVDALFIESKGD